MSPHAAQDEDHRFWKPEEFQIHMAQQSVSGGGKESSSRSFLHSVPMSTSYFFIYFFLFHKDVICFICICCICVKFVFLILLLSSRRSHYTQTSMAVFETFLRNVKRPWSSQTKVQRSSGTYHCCVAFMLSFILFMGLIYHCWRHWKKHFSVGVPLNPISSFMSLSLLS